MPPLASTPPKQRHPHGAPPARATHRRTAGRCSSSGRRAPPSGPPCAAAPRRRPWRAPHTAPGTPPHTSARRVWVRMSVCACACVLRKHKPLTPASQARPGFWHTGFGRGPRWTEHLPSVCGVVWCGVVWCGVVWCGVVWAGMVWCGVVGALGEARVGRNTFPASV